MTQILLLRSSLMKLTHALKPFHHPKEYSALKKHCKWYTPALTKLAQYKNKMHYIAKTTNSETDWRVFRNIRNTYIKSVRETKAQYYSNKLTIKNKHKVFYLNFLYLVA